MRSASESDLDSKMDLRHCEALQKVVDLVVHYGNVREHLRELAERLQSVASSAVALPALLHDT